MLRHSRGHCLDELRIVEMKKYPSLKEAFQIFLDHQNWNNYKKDIREQILTNKQLKFSTNQYRSLKSRDLKNSFDSNSKSCNNGKKNINRTSLPKQLKYTGDKVNLIDVNKSSRITAKLKCS